MGHGRPLEWIHSSDRHSKPGLLHGALQCGRAGPALRVPQSHQRHRSPAREGSQCIEWRQGLRRWTAANGYCERKVDAARRRNGVPPAFRQGAVWLGYCRQDVLAWILALADSSAIAALMSLRAK